MEMNIERALRGKYRFANGKGTITVEDLYDLSLEALDALYTKLLKEQKENDSAEGSLLKKCSVSSEVIQTKLEIVKHIFETKQRERHEAATAKERKEQKEFLLDILEKKRTANLENLTEEELQKKIAALSA